jgi:hypothetical protein
MSNHEMTNGEIDHLLNSANLPLVSTERMKRIEAALVADLKPVRPLAPAGVYLAGFAGVFVAVCLIGCYIGGQHGWHALSDLQKVAVFLPLAATTALLAFSVVRQMRPGSKRARPSVQGSASIFVFLLLAMTIVFQPAQESAFVEHGLACFRTGMTYAIPAAFLFALLLLRSAALSPALTGATAGGLAGLVGLTVLEIHCPNLNVNHIMVWHVSVTVACIILGFIFSSVTFRRWKSNP